MKLTREERINLTLLVKTFMKDRASLKGFCTLNQVYEEPLRAELDYNRWFVVFWRKAMVEYKRGL
jgi:hypothetical protein